MYRGVAVFLSSIPKFREIFPTPFVDARAQVVILVVLLVHSRVSDEYQKIRDCDSGELRRSYVRQYHCFGI